MQEAVSGYRLWVFHPLPQVVGWAGRLWWSWLPGGSAGLTSQWPLEGEGLSPRSKMDSTPEHTSASFWDRVGTALPRGQTRTSQAPCGFWFPNTAKTLTQRGVRGVCT